MTTEKISYGNRQNQENTVRAVCDAIERHPRYATCQMQDSADLNLRDARTLLDRDDLGNAKASATRAARYVFGYFAEEYKQIEILLGTYPGAWLDH